MIDLTHYTRWITASIYKHIDSKRQDVLMYIEGQIRRTQDQARWFEVRISGPMTHPNGSKDEYSFYVEVNILCQTSFDDKDTYHLKKLLGIASQALNTDICVYKYGDGVGDSSAYIGILQLMVDDGIEVHDFGQPEPTLKVIQGSVEAHYCMQIP